MFNYLVLAVFLNSPFAPADLCGDTLLRLGHKPPAEQMTDLVQVETRDCDTHKWQKKWIVNQALADNYRFVSSEIIEGKK